MSCLFAAFEICHRSHSPLCSLFQIPKPTKIQVKIDQLILSPLLRAEFSGGLILTYSKRPSMMSESTSLMARPEAATCCGMKLAAVMPGVVLISNRLMSSWPFSPERM